MLPEILQPGFPFIIFGFSLLLLLKSADIFVDSAEGLGIKLGIPHFIIGVTVVGIGTSLPELAASIASIVQSSPEDNLTGIISANIVGSNISNILLGVGIASIIKVVKVDRNLQDNDLPFLFGSTAVAMYMLSDGVLTRWEGVLLLWMFVVFIVFSVSDRSQPAFIEKEAKEIAKKTNLVNLITLLVLSGIGIILTSDFVIHSLIDVSPIIGIEQDVASMVLLGIGTSFPEVFVTVVAAMRGKTALALGNIFGSNISNILGILGISALLTDIQVSEKSIAVGVPFLAIATLFFIFSAMDNRFRIWEGLMAVAIFFAFLGSLFGLF